MAVKYDKVILNNDWLGHKSGTVIMLNSATIKTLVKRGTASIVDDTVAAKDVEDAVSELNEGAAEKDIVSQGKDKMMKKPLRQKQLNTL